MPGPAALHYHTFIYWSCRQRISRNIHELYYLFFSNLSLEKEFLHRIQS